MSAEGATASIPSSARVVIIGGGVIGCSIAYHLARRGWTDVVLLERHKLTSGTTWHAAGLVVTSGFTTSTGMQIAKYTRDLYATLEQETGFATGFDPVGLLQVAASRGDPRGPSAQGDLRSQHGDRNPRAVPQRGRRAVAAGENG